MNCARYLAPKKPHVPMSVEPGDVVPGFCTMAARPAEGTCAESVHEEWPDVYADDSCGMWELAK